MAASAPVATAISAERIFARLSRGAGLREADCLAFVTLIRQSYDVPARQSLVSNEAAAPLLVLLDGWACRQKFLGIGARQITELYLPGDLIETEHFGAVYSLEAITPCSVAPVRAIDLVHATAAHPGVNRVLNWSQRQGEAILREALVNNSQRRGAVRIAHLICEVQARLLAAGAREAEGKSVTWRMPQTDLAAVTGLSGVHVSRSLSELREDKLVTMQGRCFHIPSKYRLFEYSDFDPSYLQFAKIV